MLTMEKNESVAGKMFYGWLNSLAMYEQQLAHLKEQLNSANYKGLQADTTIEPDALKELIKAQQAEVAELT